MSELVVIAYPEENRAEQVLTTLHQLQKEYLVDLADACYVTKDQKGKDGSRLHTLLPAGRVGQRTRAHH